MMADFERIREAVLKGRFDAIADLVQETLDDGALPDDIIDKGLIGGMNEVGVLFKKDEMYMPEVLVSARTMHAGMEVLRPLLEETGARAAGRVVLGTVKGDLHDIGKNLVGMMFKGAGYDVVDIGIDQPAENFLKAVKESEAQVMGMSALLTTTMTQMGRVIDSLKEAGMRDRVKVMVGGAPVTAQFAESIGADGYAPDAGSALDILKNLINKT
jgi:5-methyltetrahydrofolate--homocysteine methyltransferase